MGLIVDPQQHPDDRSAGLVVKLVIQTDWNALGEGANRLLWGFDHDDGPLVGAKPVQLIVAKHRNGPTGEVKMTFVPDLCQFSDEGSIKRPG